jgi:hypothetical protein
MEELEMKTLGTISFVALMGVSAVALVSTIASAAVVCNEEGACWHTQGEYQYPPEVRLSVHPHDWKWNEGENHEWREHEGKGYWKGGEWKEF